MDYGRLEREILAPVLSGENPLKYGHFDWGENKVIDSKTVAHNGKIIVEGVGLFRPELLKYFKYKVWVDCPIEESITRGKKRDREEYNNPNDEEWEGTWKKNDLECFESFSPKEIADFIASNC